MLRLVDPDIISGRIKLYDWQIEFLQEFGKSALSSTSETPNLSLLVGNNGSGKDLWIIGPCAVWYLCRFLNSLVVGTTSSGTQLSTQTEPSIKRHCANVNQFLADCGNPKRIIEKQRHYSSEFTKSEIHLFATDEAGKAEGFHPGPGGKQLIITNEGKSLASEIYVALKRCHGYTDWLDISSSGEEVGDFYQNFLSPHFKLKRVIDMSMCKHISRTEYERNVEQYGLDHPFIQSSYWSKFISTGSQVLITEKQIRECISSQIPTRPIRVSIGVDIAAVCDETVLTVYNGSKFVKSMKRIGFPSMTEQEDWLVTVFNQINPDVICMDYDGIGRATVDNLINRHGFNQIIPVQFGRSANRKDMFANLGAEKWAHAQRLIEKKLIEIDKSDPILIQQLSTRRYSSEGGKIALESKKKAKARGIKSPDRADSLVLALSGFAYEELSKSSTRQVNGNIISEDGTLNYEEYQHIINQRKISTWKNLWM